MMKPTHALLVSFGSALLLAVLTLVAQAAIRFAEPERLLLMVIPALLLALYTGYLVWRGAAAARIGTPATVLAMSGSWSGRRQAARVVTMLVATVCVVLALARPQWGEQTREIRRKGIDVVFALDISRSMLAGDVAPERLAAATAEMDRLMQLLDGDRVGLVVFAGIAFVQSPLTSDYGAIRLYLDRLSPDDMPTQGTAIGRALHEATQLLTGGSSSGDFERADNQLVIVFTDGEDHETDPVRAAREANAEGIHVYTVGVGTLEGAQIPLRDVNGRVYDYLRDRNDEVVVTRLEEDQLIEVADAGGGSYHRFSTEGAAAAALEEAIAQYDEESLSTAMRQEYQDRFMFFLVPAFLLLLVSTMLGERRPGARLVSSIALLALLAGASGCDDALMRPDPRVENAMGALSEGEFEAAHEWLERVPADGRLLPEFHYDRGLIHEAEQTYRAAQDEYVRALGAQDVPAQVSALTALGNALLAQELYETAIERYRRALTLDPSHDGARRNLEIALLRLYPPCETLDDEYEDNDGASTAATLPSVVYQGEYLPPGVQPPENHEEETPTLTVCPTDADWYAIPVVGGSTLDVSVSFTRLRDDTGHAPLPDEILPTAVRIALIDVDGVTPLAVDQGLEGQELVPVSARSLERQLDEVPISATVDADGIAFLKVEVDRPLEYNYTVEITLTPPCWALEDGFESNDRRQHAATLGEDGQHEVRICATNDDWYTRVVGPEDAFFVDVLAPMQDDGTPGTIDVSFFEGAGATPSEQQQLTDRGASFDLRNPVSPTAATLSVMSVAETEGAYRVDSYFYPPCPANDRYEPNNSNEQAHAIDLQEDPPPLLHLRLCESDQDWFALPLPEVPEEDRETPTRPFSALVQVDGVPVDMRVAVYDPVSRRAVAVSQPVEGADPNAFVGDAPLTGAVAYAQLPWELQELRVLVYGAGETFYDLSFPHTEMQEQQQQEQQQEESEDQEGDPEDQQEGDSQDGDAEDSEEQESEEQEGEEEEPAPEEGEEEAQEEEAEPEQAEMTDEEAQRELLMQLLDSLESDEVNLPMQQAVEAAPNVRMRDEW